MQRISRINCIFILILVLAPSINAQQSASSASDYPSNQAPELRATRISSENAIQLDGYLDEAIWKQSEVATGFTQITPVDGGVPSQPTEAYVVYDDQYIWVGVMA